MTTHEADILAPIRELAAATTAKDPDRAMAPYAPGASLCGLAPPLRMVADDPVAGRTGLVAWFDTWAGPIGYETRDLEVLQGDDLAVIHGLLRISGTKTDGQQVSTWTRITWALRKLGEGWRIVHEHNSTPFYMDGSLKAAVDLEP